MLTPIIGLATFFAVFSLFCAFAGWKRSNPLLPSGGATAYGSRGKGEPFFVRLWNLRGDSPLTLESGMLAGAAIGAGTFFLTSLVADPVFAVPLAAGSFLLGPRALNLYLFRRRIKAFRNNIEFGLDTLMTALHIGMSMEKALREASQHSPEPIKSEFFRLAEEIAGGLPEPEAFRGLAARVPCVEAEELCDAVELYSKVGGPRSLNLLREVLTSLRDGISTRYQVHQHTKGAKTSAILVTFIPMAYIFGMLVLAPDLFRPLVDTQMGRTAAFVAFLVFCFGLWLVMNILRSIEDF